MAARDPALRRVVLPVDRRSVRDRLRLVCDPLHGDLSKGPFPLRRRRAPLAKPGDRLRLHPGHRPVPTLQPELTSMKAIVCDRRDGLKLEEIERPAVLDDGVLVRVHASSVNLVDLFPLSGAGRLMRRINRKPRQDVLGSDFAGTVESVGKNVTRFRPGDEVFGGRHGAFAEYVSILETEGLARKPAGITFEQAGTVAVAALTALQAVRDHGQVKAGQKVLINGASGGVGTFAVQIARSFGADVTAVCSPRNVETARSLGAQRVIDYTREDFTKSGELHDVLIDIAGSRSLSECRPVLKPDATSCWWGPPP